VAGKFTHPPSARGDAGDLQAVETALIRAGGSKFGQVLARLSWNSHLRQGGFEPMKKRYVQIKQYSVFLALAGLLWIVPSVSSQAVPPTPPSQYPGQDNDRTRQELASFDGFLDKHPEIAEQLRKNPTLADNKEFLQNHLALQQFLQEHPGVREQLAQDPRIFMRQEDRVDQRDNDATRRELANFDAFLDKHPEVAEQLRKNPTLADNKEFLQNHPALQQFLQEHPGVREQLAQDPRIFMREEDRFDHRDNDVKRQELANFDGFLDSHPQIAEQLSKDPSLAKNEEYLQSHPELQEYLKNHSGVQEELAENPQAFMNSMKRFDNAGTKKEMLDPPKPKQ
jgi:phage-related protein